MKCVYLYARTYFNSALDICSLLPQVVVKKWQQSKASMKASNILSRASQWSLCGFSKIPPKLTI